MGQGTNVWLSVCLMIFFFNWLHRFFPLHCAFGWASPTLSPWFITLHLCSMFRPYGDPFSSLHPWWGKDGFPWCCARCLCVYHKGCEISHFMWTNPCFFATYFLVYMLTNQHCGFSGWHSNIGWHHQSWFYSNRFGFANSSILWGCCHNCNSS